MDESDDNIEDCPECGFPVSRSIACINWKDGKLVHIECAEQFSMSSSDPTLRDLFAMGALPGIVAELDMRYPNTIAKQAYEIADAMMTARERKDVLD